MSGGSTCIGKGGINMSGGGGINMPGGSTCLEGLHALRGAGGYMLGRGGATCLTEGGLHA